MQASRMAIWCTLLISGLTGGNAVVADDPADGSGPAIRPARERLVEYWLIGGSDRGNEVRRNVKPRQVTDDGWSAFVEDRVRPAYQWGLRRFWLHNPFGTVPGEVMQFDQFLDAKEAGLNMLTDDFASAWRPVVDGRFGEPVELIAYMGVANFRDDRLGRAGSERDAAAVLATVLRCIQPILRAGASLGADAAVTMSDDGPEFHFYRFLEEIGIPVYVEARPRVAAPAWGRFPVASTNQWWLRSDPARYPGPMWLPTEEIHGGVVRIFHDLPGASSDPTDVQHVVSQVRAALLEGHTVVFRSDGIRQAGITIDQLVAGIDEQLGVDPDAVSRRTGSTGSKQPVVPSKRPAEASGGIRIDRKTGDASVTRTGSGAASSSTTKAEDGTPRPDARKRKKPAQS